jgi:hypothetical protein
MEESLASWREFLESNPPGKTSRISKFTKRRSSSVVANLPTISLHCDNVACAGERWFSPQADVYVGTEAKNAFVEYRCRNCGQTSKVFAITLVADEEGATGSAVKHGEIPPFGPPLSARVQRLVQQDRELFLKGRRCEIQGLGVGAFAYYRRVVEDNKNRFIDEIKRVADRLGSGDELNAQLETARAEIQFTKAVSSIKAAIPSSLLINGSNPLTLLHNALSRGVHELSDEECLEIAASIRIVLTEFAERIAQAIKDDEELKRAVARLQRP